MKLANLYDVQSLARKRCLLVDLRRRGTLTARLRGGSGLGSIDEDLSAELVAQLMPVIHADLDQRIASVELEMAGLGVTIDPDD